MSVINSLRVSKLLAVLATLSAVGLQACGTQGFQAANHSKSVVSRPPGESDQGAGNEPSPTPPAPTSSLIDLYQDRYHALTTTNKKLVDNKGNGYENLYGTRNFRAVLNGVAYRGGANNSYNKFGKRDNRNPLPNVGLENLCQEGFSNAVYLYSTNYTTAPKTWSCDSIHTAKATLKYSQLSPYNSTGIKAMFTQVMTTIKNPKVGPIYLHCWNGWHASGLISALMLRQFCDYTGKEASAYWDLNTDGSNTDPAFVKLRKQITDFVPYPEFKIDAATQARICALP